MKKAASGILELWIEVLFSGQKLPNYMERNNSHLAGEYFVAAELYRRGFSVGMTIGNAKAIDLFVNRDNKTLSIQVKAIRNKKSVGWPMMKAKVIDDILYIFVNLNDR